MSAVEILRVTTLILHRFTLLSSLSNSSSPQIPPLLESLAHHLQINHLRSRHALHHLPTKSVSFRHSELNIPRTTSLYTNPVIRLSPTPQPLCRLSQQELLPPRSRMPERRSNCLGCRGSRFSAKDTVFLRKHREMYVESTSDAKRNEGTEEFECRSARGTECTTLRLPGAN